MTSETVTFILFFFNILPLTNVFRIITLENKENNYNPK